MSVPNQFEIIGETPFSELEERLRGVTLLDQPDIRPYEDAKISIERFTYDIVNSGFLLKGAWPTSKYVLRRQLAVQRAIRACISLAGYDQLELEGGLIIVGGDKGTQGLIPPIVEAGNWRLNNGRKTVEISSQNPFIIDGIHRTYQGRHEAGRESFLGLFIQGIREDCPPYAEPNSWSQVKVRDELPEDRHEWKNYIGDVSKGEQYALYRDYSLLNGSTPRVDNK